jgi:2-iminobutanoate/2-iminopropanoate deaminase
MKTVIYSKNAPAAVGPYSQAILAGNMLFLSGQMPIDPQTGLIAGQTIEEQARQVFKNVGAVLDEAGFKWDDIVKSTLFIRDMEAFARVNEIYAECFAGIAPPARSCVEVSRLPKNALIEMECIAVR